MAQVITLAFMPLITRIYGPESLGLQGVFTALVTVLATAAALAYPISIVLPDTDEEASTLALLSIVLALLTSLVMLLALSFIGPDILRFLNAESIISFFWLIPIAIFFHTLNTTAGQWLIRQKAYKINAASVAINALLVNGAKTSVGLLLPSPIVLIISTSTGYICNAAISFFGWKRTSTTRPKSATVVNPARNFLSQAGRLGLMYRDFPLLRMPQNLINSFSQALPPLLLAALFDTRASGQYAIAASALLAPTALIGNAVSSVFYPRITEAIRAGEDSRALIIKGTWAMTATGALPFMAIILFGPNLFSFVFGSEWARAGSYAQLLAPWLFLQFVNKPAVAALPALRLQGGLLIYEVFSTGSKVFALWIGFHIFNSDLWAIGLFSAAGVAAYLWLILWTIQQAGKRK